MTTVELRTTAPAVGGEAVAREDAGRVVFVSGALPDERVRVVLDEERSSFARGQVVEVLLAARDAEQEARWGRYWMDVGVGGWDRERRPSEVRLDRLVELSASGVRREGAALDRGVFDQVVAEARRYHALG